LDEIDGRAQNLVRSWLVGSPQRSEGVRQITIAIKPAPTGPNRS